MFDRILTVAEYVLIAVSFATITFLAFVNVVARYVFHASFSFTSELLVNLAVLLTLVGAAAATRQGSHPGFSMLRDSSSGALKKGVTLFVCAMMLVFYLVFLWLGYDMVESQALSGRLTPALGFPQWIFSLALPFGALLGALRVIQLAVIALRGGDAFVSEEELVIEAAEEEAKAFEEAQEARKP